MIFSSEELHASFILSKMRFGRRLGLKLVWLGYGDIKVIDYPDSVYHNDLIKIVIITRILFDYFFSHFIRLI